MALTEISPGVGLSSVSGSFDHKNRLDLLLAVHAVVAGLCGFFALFFPQVFGHFLGGTLHSEFMRLSPSHEFVKFAHIIVRMYGALILGQAVIVWHVRNTADAGVRRGVMKAYCATFFPTAAVLLWSNLVDAHWHFSNWLNVLLFACLAGLYGAVFFCSPPSAFESQEKKTKES